MVDGDFVEIYNTFLKLSPTCVRAKGKALESMLSSRCFFKDPLFLSINIEDVAKRCKSGSVWARIGQKSLNASTRMSIGQRSHNERVTVQNIKILIGIEKSHPRHALSFGS